MISKYALLRRLNRSELIEIAQDLQLKDADYYYVDPLCDLIAENLSRKEVIEYVSAYRPNYLDWYVDERRKNTYLYVLKNGHEIVYYGITYYPEDRINSHKKSGKVFTNSSILHGPMFRENAELREWDYITKYQVTHGGRPPKYNKAKITGY